MRAFCEALDSVVHCQCERRTMNLLVGGDSLFEPGQLGVCRRKRTLATRTKYARLAHKPRYTTLQTCVRDWRTAVLGRCAPRSPSWYREDMPEQHDCHTLRISMSLDVYEYCYSRRVVISLMEASKLRRTIAGQLAFTTSKLRSQRGRDADTKRKHSALCNIRCRL